MFSSIYFPFVAALSAGHESTLSRVKEGRINEAAASASRLASREDSDDGGSALLRLCADMNLAVGQFEEAEDGYRRALRAVRDGEQRRALSCRDAGWQALFRQRTGTAVTCFSRVIDEPGLPTSMRIEARFALVAALGELGRPDEASLAFLALCEDPEIDLPQWRDLIKLLRLDIAVQHLLRHAAELSDHVYWRSDTTAVPQLFELPSWTQELAMPQATILAERLACLQSLQALAGGDRNAFSTLQLHQRWAQRAGLTDYQRTLRIEIALAALARNETACAEQTLPPFSEASRECNGRIGIEYLYCYAKIRRQQGRVQDALQIYQRYSLQALRATREEGVIARVFKQRDTTRGDAPLDDVAVRLPAKYRRAYRFLQANVDRHDLSVREIAAEIGVTKRALQAAFKAYLGLAPTEVIRRIRMEGIRAELQSGAPNARVLDAANRWGVTHRSTLVNSYRKYFDESPSETLAR